MKTSYVSGLRILTWAILLSAVGFTSCKKDDKDKPVPPPVQLVDQIEYDGGEPINIRSAVYEVEDTDLYTFYLSPTAGITGIEEMLGANDYLAVKVRNPKGVVDPATGEFEISYLDIKVSGSTLSEAESVTLQADLQVATSQLNLVAEVAMVSGKTLRVNYNNSCPEALLPPLNNEYELDGVPTSIGSVLLWNDPETGARNYYFYAESGVTEPQDGLNGLVITVAKDAGTSFDFSTADPEQVKAVYGTFQTSDASTTGTLTLEINAQTGALTVLLDARQGDSRLRASYTGAFVEGFDCLNYIKVTENDAVEEQPLTKIFINEGTSNILTFGLVEAESPEDLKTGHYAVSLTLSTAQLQGGTADIAAVRAQLFDYQLYKTWDNAVIASGVTGSVTTARTVDGSKTFIRFSVQYPEGPAFEGEWFGELTPQSEVIDMTPVEPFRPHITITQSDGVSVVYDATVSSMEVRMQKNYRLRGGDPQYGGATFDTYVFYFRPEDSDDDIESKYSIPQFWIPVSYLGQSDIDLTSGAEDLHWALKYQGYGLQLTEYTENYTMYGSTYGNCPLEAKATVVRNDDKTWKVTFTMTDKYMSYGFESGTGNTLVIEWEGPATKYSGSQQNDMTDADY